MTQSQLLQMAVTALERREIAYALVGSLASSALGEPRFTTDIDIVVDLDVFDAALLCDEFQGEEFFVYKPAAIEEAARGGQFQVVHAASSNKIDFILVGDSDWSRGQLQRRRQLDLLDAGPCYVAAPEDVILGKLLYYREGGSEKHLRDITGILVRSGDSIDQAYLDRHAIELGVAEEWRSILDKLAGN